MLAYAVGQGADLGCRRQLFAVIRQFRGAGHIRKLRIKLRWQRIGVGTGTSTPALAASTIDPFAMMTTVTDLPTSHYVDYSLVFN